VVTGRATLVALLVMLTVAFGITAPVSSVTTPEMVPVGACAIKLTARMATSNIDREKSLDMDTPFIILKQNKPMILPQPHQTNKKQAHAAKN
jgi:hypothetical protein